MLVSVGDTKKSLASWSMETPNCLRVTRDETNWLTKSVFSSGCAKYTESPSLAKDSLSVPQQQGNP